MPRVIVTVPVELAKEGDQYLLIFRNAAGHEQMTHLDELAETPLEWEVLLSWANEQFKRAFLKRRRATGVNDDEGTPIMEGDILGLVENATETPSVFHGAVKWCPKRAAFVIGGQWQGTGQLWTSENLAEAPGYRIIGNVFENPDLLVVEAPKGSSLDAA